MEAAEVYKYLIKRLREIIDKEKGVPDMPALRRRCLTYSKAIMMPQ